MKKNTDTYNLIAIDIDIVCFNTVNVLMRPIALSTCIRRDAIFLRPI